MYHVANRKRSDFTLNYIAMAIDQVALSHVKNDLDCAQKHQTWSTYARGIQVGLLNLSMHSFVTPICFHESLFCIPMTFISIICYNEISHVEEFNKPSFAVLHREISFFQSVNIWSINRKGKVNLGLYKNIILLVRFSPQEFYPRSNN